MRATWLDLGRLNYRGALAVQGEHLAGVLDARERGRPEVGRVLLVEHDPVVTIGRHPGAARHVLAAPERLRELGIELVETDRGGDVTYHGPGQLVAYPILDLNVLGLGIHDYMRLLESAVVRVCGRAGLRAGAISGRTGVWVVGEPSRKICAMGVRIRRWASMHGLAINVTTNLGHFDVIVPCGLADAEVTSFAREFGVAAPSMEVVKAWLRESLDSEIDRALARSSERRARHAERAGP